VRCDALEVRAALAGAMKKEHERPRFVARPAGRFVEEIWQAAGRRTKVASSMQRERAHGCAPLFQDCEE
jgi:hypothetical protein